MNDTNKKVSVSVVTYNHKDYIKQCLDGILMQQTNFDYEIILGEDESNDGTREICMDYANRYPDKIRLFLRSRKDVIYINGNPTGRYNFIENLKACRGNYIALCEGDDYWTDPLKLQKQVDFLEANEDYGICFHKTKQLNMFDETKNFTVPNIHVDTVFTIEDYILNNKTATCSLVFKKKCFNRIPDWFCTLPFGDLGLILIIMNNSNKKGLVFNDVMGVYRIHEGGIHGKLHKNNMLLIEAYKTHINFIDIMKNKFFLKGVYNKEILKKKKETYNILLRLAAKENANLTYYKYKVLSKLYALRLKLLK